MSPDLKPGISFDFEYTVPDDKTVPNLYPEWQEFREMPDVFATGFLVGLMEGACQLSIKPYLDWPREQSVGTHVNFSHLAATPPGLTVRVHCEVVAVAGRKVAFRASAHDGHELISEGTHERVIIDVARFNEKLTPKRRTPRAA
jgi:fluoroacetyl-CoA thioesterase